MKTTDNYYSRIRPEIASFVPSNIKTILDVGCGQGSFLKLVKEKTGAETWGIEMETEVAEKAKNIVDNILAGKIEDMLSYVPAGYFDCITFNDVLEHLIEPTEVLKNIRSKLSENGSIIASIPNIRYINIFYELLIKKDWKYKDSGILDSTHLRFFTKKSMKRMFENADYTIMKQKGINPKTTWTFRLFNIFTLGILNDTRYLEFICIAKSKIDNKC
jgi:2-polyprenyl-3-methyl-5-hydroxy-6-metoxy-1,4-benzoquinol methylase